MTEIATRGAAAEVATTTAPALDEWLTQAASAGQLARGLVASFWVPAAYKPDIPRNADPEERAAAVEVAVANATGAILFGWRLGLDPMTSLQQVYVVHGRPGMYAKMKVALAQAAGHEVWDEVYTAERAVVCGRRRGSEQVVRIEITIEQARTAGWTSNAAYGKTPADMLWARAASRVVDRIAADLLHGITSIEDIEPDPEAAPVRVSAAQVLTDVTPLAVSVDLQPGPHAVAAGMAPTSPTGGVVPSGLAGVALGDSAPEQVVAVPAASPAEVAATPPGPSLPEPAPVRSPAAKVATKAQRDKMVAHLDALGVPLGDRAGLVAEILGLDETPEAAALTGAEVTLILDNAEVAWANRLDAEALAAEARAEHQAAAADEIAADRAAEAAGGE